MGKMISAVCVNSKGLQEEEKKSEMKDTKTDVSIVTQTKGI
jgi:hypothetical protein